MDRFSEHGTGQPQRLPRHAPPRRAGVGFKPQHLPAIVADTGRVGFFEVHAENYMCKGGPALHMLDRLRMDYPVSVHGVGLSIGGAEPLSLEHLARLRTVVDRFEPFLVSEHLAWSTHDTAYFNDLLPLPYTPATLARVVAHVDQVQTTLGRTILLENPSTYVLFEDSEIAETDFIAEISERTGCGLLLDVNNVLVSATNHGFAAEDYLADFPLHRVGEIHLAGHAPARDDAGQPFLIDAHDRPVADGVWTLFEAVIARTGAVPTLIEWDNDVPDWPVLKAEAAAADAILQRCTAEQARHAG